MTDAPALLASGGELHRFAYPSSRQARAKAEALNDGRQTLEPSMRIAQIAREPVFPSVFKTHPLVEVRFGWAFESLEQDTDRITAMIRSTEMRPFTSSL